MFARIVIALRGEAARAPNREQIAKIIAPELYGSPMSYPQNIESDEDLNFYRGQALNQADAILALSGGVAQPPAKPAPKCLCCEEVDVANDGDECEFCRITYSVPSTEGK